MDISDQVVFVSIFPDPLNDREGTMQRAKSIDSLVHSQTRLYLDISIKKHLRSSLTVIDERARVLHLNALVHFFWIAWIVAKAPLVYVHSVYNAIYIAPLYLLHGSKIITDMHGIVPEELRMAQKPVKAATYEWVEKWVLRFSVLIVTVSHSMTEFFVEKYPSLYLKPKILEVPIINFSDSGISLVDKKNSGSQIKIVYGGGTQVWQNFDLMIQTAIHLKNIPLYDIAFYVPDVQVDWVTKRLQKHGLSQVTVASLPHSQLLEVYKSAHLGFLLRDDIAVNRVAMPTKAMEYLEYGVIPIVITPRIGDLQSYGYKYLMLDELVSKVVWMEDELDEMRKFNYQVAANIRTSAEVSKNRLQAYLNSLLKV